MRLKQFVVLLSIVYAIVICGGFLSYRLWVVFPQLQDNTLALHKRDMQSVSKAFESEKDHLRTLVNDWAKWDDSYQFAQDVNLEYQQSNLVPSTFFDANLHGIYFLRKNKRLLFGLERESEQISVLQINAESPRIKPYADIALPTNEQSNCGFVEGHHGYELYCIASIQDSDLEQPANGYLVFSRILDDAFLASIASITKTEFEVMPSLHGGSANSFLNELIPVSKADDILLPRADYIVGIESESNGVELALKMSYPSNQLPRYFDLLTLYVMAALLMVPIVIFLIVSRFVVNPLADMSRYFSDLKEQENLPVLQGKHFIHEVTVLRKAVSELMQHVRNERLALQQKSLTDALTGIKNRRAFDEQMTVLWNTVPRINKPVVIILADIDYFKNYNDSLGHVKGDQALQAIALALRSACRRSSDQIFRYGGEEFAITLVLERVEDLSLVMESIQKSVSLLYFPHPSSKVGETMTVSMGACLIPAPDSWMQQLPYKHAVEIADQALYKAKEAGRNTYVIDRLEEQI